MLDVRGRSAAEDVAARAGGLSDGVLHVPINNAGVTAPGMSQAALKFLPTDGAGRIINVVSSAGTLAANMMNRIPLKRGMAAW